MDEKNNGQSGAEKVKQVAKNEIKNLRKKRP